MNYAFRITCVALGAVSIGACGWLLPDGVLSESVALDATATSDAPVTVGDASDDGPSTDADVPVIEPDYGPCLDEPFTKVEQVLQDDNSPLGPAVLSADELRAYYVAGNSVGRLSRSSRSGKFGNAMPVLSSSIAIRFASITPNEKTLYGSDDENLYWTTIPDGGSVSDWSVLLSGSLSTKYRIPMAVGANALVTTYISSGSSSTKSVFRFSITDRAIGAASSPSVMPGSTSYYVTNADETVAFFAHYEGEVPTVYRTSVELSGAPDASFVETQEIAYDAGTQVPLWLSPNACRLYLLRDGLKMFVATRAPADAGAQ